MPEADDAKRSESIGRGHADRASRRAALAKLGLSAGAVYVAPTVLALREASGQTGNTEVPACEEKPRPPKCDDDPPGGGPPDDPGPPDASGGGNPNP